MSDGGTPGRLDAADFARKRARETPTVTTIESTPAQVLSGIRIGVSSMAQCSHCARSIGEASEVAVRGHRMSDESRWSVAQVLCYRCIERHGTIQTPTPGAVECVVRGQLVLRGDVAAQEHRLAFAADDGESAVLDFSGARDGRDS